MRYFLFSILLVVISCNKNDNVVDDFLNSIERGVVFGVKNDECEFLFLLKSDGIYTDSIIKDNVEKTVFKKEPLSQKKYELARHLLDVPDAIDEMDHQFLVDDDTSLVAYYLQVGITNNIRSWTFNSVHPSMDSTLQNYLANIKKLSYGLEPISLDEVIWEEGIIFGNVFGLCTGDCRRLYLLKPDAIYEDADIDSGTDWKNTTFKTTPMSSDTFEMAKMLLDLPASFLNSGHNYTTIRGADIDYYIQISLKEKKKIWTWFKPTEESPPEIKNYMIKLQDITNQLK